MLTAACHDRFRAPNPNSDPSNNILVTIGTRAWMLESKRSHFLQNRPYFVTITNSHSGSTLRRAIKNRIQQRQARSWHYRPGICRLASGPALQRTEISGYWLRYRPAQGRDPRPGRFLHLPHSAPEEIQAAKAQGFSRHFGLFPDRTKWTPIIICVPTPLNEYHEPDLSFITDTTQAHRASFAGGPADHSREHDLSRHHGRSHGADSGEGETGRA